MASEKNILIKVLLLELLCYVPVAIIIGNVVPPIGPLKIHWIYIGIIFLITLTLIAASNYSRKILGLLLMFYIVQFIVSIRFSPSDFVDFISGPVLFIAITNLVVDEQLSIYTLRRIRKKILIGFALPICIAVFQYLGFMPLEFWNAQYVNVTVYGTEEVARVNGFLYHGIELAVIIFFFFTGISFQNSKIRTYIRLVLMIFFEFMIVIKAGIIAAILYFVFFAYLIDRNLRSMKVMLIVGVAALGLSYIYTLIPDIQEQRFNFDLNSFKFEDQLFTGRGHIWNIFIEGISDFGLPQILFGSGFGSVPLIYEKYATPGEELYGTHNQLLELLVNGGLFSVWFIYYIIQKQYKKLSVFFFENKALFQKYYLGIVFIPLLTMGITAPIMSMYIYWCGLSAVIITLRIKLSKT